ncbi:MAG: 5-formyltetrahydrofolate cyclo-ligase [Clostridia bacterium]|nr:5-formyltetrahydrofolate cyclo-ligase [Clostridia bacterium]
MNKKELRGEMRARRRQLPEREQREAAQAVFERLLAFEPYQRAKSVMAYMACRGELDLGLVIEDALKSGRTLLAPRCEPDRQMTARRIAGYGDLAPGTYGLMEPKADCVIASPQSIDLILVPGAAFDRAGGRIGQGAGYYDRFLAETNALRVGICHSFALLERVPGEAHDIQMDYVITPGGIIRTGQEAKDDGRT